MRRVAARKRKRVSGRLLRLGQGGFTLIETVVSVIVILIATAGLFAIFTTSITPRNTPQPFEIATGAQYVQEKLEMVLGDRRNPSASKGFANIDTAHYPSETLASGYSRTTTVGSWPVNTDTATYKQITVQVTHNGSVVAQGVLLVASYP
jgi:prepilin-type N-terminal cleavage/methylation domain-containing protein